MMSDVSCQIEMKLPLHICAAFKVTDPLKPRRKMSMVSVCVWILSIDQAHIFC